MIGIVDDDDVSLSNLQRQVLHGVADIGRPKVESAAAAAARLNPHVGIEPHRFRLTEENAGSPDRALRHRSPTVPTISTTRYLVSDACFRAGGRW